MVTLTTPQLQPGSPKCSPEASHPGDGPSPTNQTHIPLYPDISSLPAVPGNAGSVVHPSPLADTAEPEAPAAGQEGEQRGVCPEYPVRPWGGAGGTAPGLQTQSDVRVLPGGGPGCRQCPDFLAIPRGCLEAGLESLLKAAGGNLLILRISHCPNILTDRSLWLASCYCRALQAVTYRWVPTAGSEALARGIPGLCIRIPFPPPRRALGQRDPRALQPKGKEQRPPEWVAPAFVFSTEAPQTQWAMRSSGPWAQAAERSSPSRWRHFTPGEQRQ